MQDDPLFLACTRPIMFKGVPIEAVVFGLMITMIFFLLFKNPLVALLYIPLHTIFYVICIKDPKIFRLVTLWSRTKAKANTKAVWKCSSSSPFHKNKSKKK